MNTFKLFSISSLALLLLATSTPAHAGSSSVPEDVEIWFQTNAVGSLASNEDQIGEPLSASLNLTNPVIGEPTQAFTLDEHGNLVGLNEWTAAISSEGNFVGTMTAWRDPTHGRIDLAVYDNAVNVAESIDQVSDSESKLLIVDPLGEGRAVFDSEQATVLPVEGQAEQYGEFAFEEYQAGIESALVDAPLGASDTPDDLAGGMFGGFSIANNLRNKNVPNLMLPIGAALAGASGAALLLSSLRRRRVLHAA